MQSHRCIIQWCILPIPSIIHITFFLLRLSKLRIPQSKTPKKPWYVKTPNRRIEAPKARNNEQAEQAEKGKDNATERENLEFQGNAAESRRLGRESANKSSEGPNPPSFTCCSGHTSWEISCEGCGDVVDLFRCRQDLLCSFSGNEHDGG